MAQTHHDNIYFQIVFYYIPWVAVLVLVFSLSNQPAQNLPRVENVYLDKIAHLIEFFIVGLCTFRVFQLWAGAHASFTQQKYLLLYLALFSFVVLFGLVDEIHQTYIQGRTCDLLDIIMDGLGALIVIVLHKTLVRKGAIEWFV